MTDSEFVSKIVTAYALAQEDITALAEAIQKARLAMMQASYRSAQRVVGLKPNWTPTKAVLHRAEKRSRADAQSIAETHRTLLRSFIEKVLEMKKSISGLHVAGWRDIFGTLANAAREMISNVAQWLADFLGWKSDQIVDVSCGSGLSDGTDQFIEDNYGNVIDTETGEVIDWSDYAIQVLPEESSSDICKEYAGRLFDISENDSIIALPAHPSCPHYKIIVQI